MTDDEAAYHEAAHAIVAMRLGYSCSSVSIGFKNTKATAKALCVKTHA